MDQLNILESLHTIEYYEHKKDGGPSLCTNREISSRHFIMWIKQSTEY